MSKAVNPYSMLVPYLPMDSFELLRPRIIPAAGDQGHRESDALPPAPEERKAGRAARRAARRYRSNQ